MKKRASAAKERAPAWRAGAPAGLKEPPARLGPLSRWLRPLRPLCVFMALLVAALAQLQAFAVPEAVLRAAGNYPKAKTEQTVKSEKELAKLAEYETRIKASIKDAEISRTKLLAQKRAELKQIRKVRDDAAKKELEEIKGRKTKQETLVKELKKQLAAAKKAKSALLKASLEVAVKLAESKLDGIKAEKKKVDDKLAKSYKDYKATYDLLTARDLNLKKILDMADGFKAKINRQKDEFKKLKDAYSKNIKAKEFLPAQGQMAGLVVLQKNINANYDLMLNYKKQFKSDYYEQVVNYRL